MELFYMVVFGALAAVAAFFELTKGKGASMENAPKDFWRFRTNYTLVYALMMAGDWLQGPYVYALYQHYGFDRGDIGRLFIAGFGSSAVFGTIVGSLADKTGRKKAALTYVITYCIGCATKHWNMFAVLLVGRLFCGVATSLLYSAFESWLVAEHFKRGYDGELLGGTFSRAVFVGNGLVAIVAGLVAHTLVETLGLGPVIPFDTAALVMICGGVLVLFTWTENFGNSSEKRNFLDQLKNGAHAIANDQKIALLGAMQSLFEGSMYTFVFLWTPALSPAGEHLPHGMIFACFMVASMAGSALAGRLLAPALNVRVERYMQAVFAVSAVALFVPVIFNRTKAPDDTDSLKADAPGISFEGQIQLVAFCVFEFCVGLFWPSMMKMRAAHVPEEMRATIINFFRIPLNLFVCIVLYNVSSFPLSTMFGMCSAFLGICVICQRRLDQVVRYEHTLADSNATLLSKSALPGVSPGRKHALDNL
ncbi:g2470 [Coccomyxa viridis]|uniref:Molybdate-anion transporter n=1 Tax=Coccomyxa viridis TaxID=1274662 RepID=A0ABP1FM45_9CHLO